LILVYFQKEKEYKKNGIDYKILLMNTLKYQ